MKEYKVEIMWDGEIYLDIVYAETEEQAIQKAQEKVERKITYNIVEEDREEAK